MYPSDISREACGKIEEQLPAATKGTRPRGYDLYDVFCAVLYVLKEGCTWRALPHDDPKWENCYNPFRRWKKPDDNGETLLDRLSSKQVKTAREEMGRAKQAAMIIVDSKSIKNTESARGKGHDAGEKLPESSRALASIQTACPMRHASVPRT
jgi:transposase